MARTWNTLLAQTQGESGAGGTGGTLGTLGTLIGLAILVLVVAGYWKVFAKAGLPGWGALIPIYNLILWLRLGGRPGWWVLLLLVPFLNIILGIIVTHDVSMKFGKGAGYTVGLIFLPFIFYPILGFGSAQYHPALARLRQRAATA